MFVTILALCCLLVVAAAQTAPATFQIVFNTTVSVEGQNQIVINVTRAWSPHGADRLWQLLQPSVNYYSQNGFFRYVQGFVVQFGISGIPSVAQHWEQSTIPDDPVLLSNTPGVVSFADAGPNTRTTQLFINYGNNTFLDAQGFSGVGKIVQGMNVALAIYGGYGGNPSQSDIYSQGNAYLKANFPKLSYITTATVRTA